MRRTYSCFHSNSIMTGGNFATKLTFFWHLQRQFHLNHYFLLLPFEAEAERETDRGCSPQSPKKHELQRWKGRGQAIVFVFGLWIHSFFDDNSGHGGLTIGWTFFRLWWSVFFCWFWLGGFCCDCGEFVDFLMGLWWYFFMGFSWFFLGLWWVFYGGFLWVYGWLLVVDLHQSRFPVEDVVEGGLLWTANGGWWWCWILLAMWWPVDCKNNNNNNKLINKNITTN